jgi:hypothetical protein
VVRTLNREENTLEEFLLMNSNGMLSEELRNFKMV